MGYHHFSRHAPTKSEYYNEDYSAMPREDMLELFEQESREAAGLLLDAINHVGRQSAAAKIMHEIRDAIIFDEIQNGQNSDAVRFKTLWLYRANTAGIPPDQARNLKTMNDDINAYKDIAMRYSAWTKTVPHEQINSRIDEIRRDLNSYYGPYFTQADRNFLALCGILP